MLNICGHLTFLHPNYVSIQETSVNVKSACSSQSGVPCGVGSLHAVLFCGIPVTSVSRHLNLISVCVIKNILTEEARRHKRQRFKILNNKNTNNIFLT
jgi:hypothetical protein